MENPFERTSRNLIRTEKNFSIKGFFTVTNSETSLLRGQRLSRLSVSNASYTLSTSDYLVAITSLVTAPSIGLPDPRLVGVGKNYIIKDEVGGAATTTITITSDGERTIDGASSTTLTTNYQAKRFYSDSSNWFTF